MDDITKALYSNHLNIIRNEAEEVEEYDVVNEQDIKELDYQNLLYQLV